VLALNISCGWTWYGWAVALVVGGGWLNPLDNKPVTGGDWHRDPGPGRGRADGHFAQAPTQQGSRLKQAFQNGIIC